MLTRRSIWLAAALVAVLAAVLAILSVLPASTQRTRSTAPVAIAIDAAQVPLNPREPARTAASDFQYAGGLVLTSQQTDKLHGLSDLDLAGDRLIAVSDLGNFVEARLVLDAGGRLIGVADATVSPMVDPDGRLPAAKEDADAEGIALLPNGDRIVSLERRDQVWRYAKESGNPTVVPSPAARFPFNSGMEALAADPDRGSDAYIVGAEESGQIWSCRLTSPCAAGPSIAMPRDFALVAMRRLPGLRTAYLLRAYDNARGNRSSLRIVGAAGPIAQMDLVPPMTVDNFEGLAALPRPDGAMRFYLLSDDNASASQRTLLLAFDWTPR